MLDDDEVAELLRIKKCSTYEVIRKISAEQEARLLDGGGGRRVGRPVQES